jgi:hypothetical protein
MLSKSLAELILLSVRCHAYDPRLFRVAMLRATRTLLGRMGLVLSKWWGSPMGAVVDGYQEFIDLGSYPLRRIPLSLDLRHRLHAAI